MGWLLALTVLILYFRYITPFRNASVSTGPGSDPKFGTFWPSVNLWEGGKDVSHYHPFSLGPIPAFHPSGVGKWVPASAGKTKAGMVHCVSGWTRGVQVKLWDPLRTRAIPERLRSVFTTRRYTNPRLPYFTFWRSVAQLSRRLESRCKKSITAIEGLWHWSGRINIIKCSQIFDEFELPLWAIKYNSYLLRLTKTVHQCLKL